MMSCATCGGEVMTSDCRHDVVERLVLEVDQIYHLACPASPVHYKCAHNSVAL